MNAPIEAHLMVYLHCDAAESTRYTGGNRSTSTLPLTRRGPPRETGPFERPEAEIKRAPVRANPGPGATGNEGTDRTTREVGSDWR